MLRGHTAVISSIFILCCLSLRNARGAEIDKQAIAEQWRKEIQTLKEAYTNCQISGELHADKGFDDGNLELVHSFSYGSRGKLKRMDFTNAELLARLNESWIIGQTEAYTIFRDEADQPYKLYRRSVEKDQKKYEDMRIMTPYMLLRNDRIGAGPFSVPDWGMECPEFIAQKSVRLESDEHPDPKHPTWRKFSGTLEIEAGQPPRAFSITVDENTCWAIVEYQFSKSGVKSTYKFIYGDNGEKVPKLARLEMHADVEGKRSGIAGEYRITDIKFEPPKMEAFELSAFGIAADAAEEANQ